MKNFFIFDQTAGRTPYYNLAVEEALALNLSKFGFSGGVRFWRNERSIILGISDSLTKNVVSEKLSSFQENFDSIVNSKNNLFYDATVKSIKTVFRQSLKPRRQAKPIHLQSPEGVFAEAPFYIARRCSGGGTVFHEREYNLNYSLFASVKEKPELYPVKESYERLLQFLIGALENQNIKARFLGKSDLAIEENSAFKKISGNAQFRKKDTIVQHGTLILNKELIGKVHEVLVHPPDEPDYRKNRKHSDFITSLPDGFDVEKFKEDLSKNFREYLGANKSDKISQKKFLTGVFRDAKTLVSEKYANKEFIFSKE